jgi:hypothetical protein
LLLLQVPPAVASLNEIPDPEQTDVVLPDIDTGAVRTVVNVVAGEPHPVE